jgi:hypothetical protein
LEWLSRYLPQPINELLDGLNFTSELAMFNWLKKICFRRRPEKDDLRLYPNARSCVRSDMSSVTPQQMPPLMVRKAAWRK